jgi:5-oxoprolinase (ATP-hydrolysing)
LALLAQMGSDATQADRIELRQRVHLRYEGTDSALVVPWGDLAQLVAGFEAAYRQRFAFLMQGKALVVEAVSVEAVLPGDAPEEAVHALNAEREVPRRDTVSVYAANAQGVAKTCARAT